MKVSVIGSGTMGPGIAQVFAQNRNDAELVDVDEKFLRGGKETIRQNLDFFVEARVTTKSEAEEAFGRVATTTDLERSVSAADYVVEAVPENFDLKKKIFERVESTAPHTAILATNTSSLSITKLAKLMKDPSRLIGTHYLNPPHLVKIVEIVLGEKTSPEIADKVLETLRSCGKKPVVVKDVAGFIHNRLICALLREAMYMAANGIASVESIDTIVKEAFGPRFPLVGVFGLEDMVGLDVLRDVSNQVFPTLDNSKTANSWLEEKIASGKLGVKSGSGFYDYPTSSAAKTRQLLTQRFVDILKQEETKA
jgi:3-hydroxybutyryl-CoA dehydrogenase